MPIKVKNALIKVFCYLLSGVGSALIITYQYIIKDNQTTTAVKVAIPCLLALLILFLVYYKAIKQKINRKLTAIETAKEIGKAPKTNTVVATLLETIGVIIPLSLMSVIFIIGGNCLYQVGIILLEIMAVFSTTIIGNIVCDANTKKELKENERKKAEELADRVASKIPTKYQ